MKRKLFSMTGGGTDAAVSTALGGVCGERKLLRTKAAWMPLLFTLALGLVLAGCPTVDEAMKWPAELKGIWVIAAGIPSLNFEDNIDGATLSVGGGSGYSLVSVDGKTCKVQYGDYISYSFKYAISGGKLTISDSGDFGIDGTYTKELQ